MREPWVVIGGWALSPLILRGIFGAEGALFVDANDIAPLLVDEGGGLRPDWRSRVADHLVSRGAVPGGCRLGGWSTGAMMAASVSPLLKPRRLALLSAAGAFCVREGWGGGWPRRVLRRMRTKLAGDPGGVARDFLERCGNPGDGSPEARYPVESLDAGLAFLEHYAHDPRAGPLGAPALAFHGREDRIVALGAGREFAERAGARFEEFAGGHLFFASAANAAAIRDLL